jgi:hypothetical protein
VVGTSQTAHGRTAVRDLITYLHTQAFDASPKVKTVLAADGHAAVECDFIGTHTGVMRQQIEGSRGALSRSVNG